MSKVVAITKLTAQPGKRDDLAKALQALLNNVATEPGTEQYILHSDNNDADVLWTYEVFLDQSSLDAHSGSEAMKAAGPQVAPFLAGEPEIRFLTPLGGKGL